jgi:hypothetical protein
MSTAVDWNGNAMGAAVGSQWWNPDGNGSYSDALAFDIWILNALTNSGVFFPWVPDYGWDGFLTPTLYYTCPAQIPGAATNVLLSFQSFVIRSGDTPYTNLVTEYLFTNTITVTNAFISVEMPRWVFTNYGTTNYMVLKLNRYGTNAVDTVGDVFNVFGIKLKYAVTN